MLGQCFKKCLKLSAIVFDLKYPSLRTFIFIFFLSANATAHTIDDFPDEQSKQVYENFLTDYNEYARVYRINFYDYETKENTKNAPCSFDKNPLYKYAEKCVTDLLKEGGWLIVGDSHGRDLYNSLKMIYPQQNIAMFQQSSCAPAKQEQKKGAKEICFKDLPTIINFINHNDAVQKVIFAARFQNELGTEQFIDDVKNGLYQKDIVIFNAGPAIAPDPMSYVKQEGVKDSYLISEAATHKVQAVNEKLEKAINANVRIFDTYSVFCDVNGTCKLLNNLHPIFRDNDSHLLKEGMKLYGESIKKSKILE